MDFGCIICNTLSKNCFFIIYWGQRSLFPDSIQMLATSGNDAALLAFLWPRQNVI